jgi:hypothetical protein
MTVRRSRDEVRLDRTSEQFLGVTQLCQAHNVISWVRNQSTPLDATRSALEPITAAEAPPPPMDRRSAAPFGSLDTKCSPALVPWNQTSLPFTVGLFPPTAFLHLSSHPLTILDEMLSCPTSSRLTRVCPHSPSAVPCPSRPPARKLLQPTQRPTASILPGAGPVPDLDSHMFRRSAYPLVVSVQSISHRADFGASFQSQHGKVSSSSFSRCSSRS